MRTRNIALFWGTSLFLMFLPFLNADLYTTPGDRIYTERISNDVYASPISSQWERAFGSPNSDTPRDVIITSDGGAVSVSWLDPSGSNKNALIVKMTSDGEVEWQKEFGDSNDEYISTIIQTHDDSYVFAALKGSLLNSPIIVVKLNGLGVILWQVEIDGLFSDRLKIRETSDGYLIGASTNNGVWVGRLNTNGTQLIQQYEFNYDNVPNVDFQLMLELIATSDGGFAFMVDHWISGTPYSTGSTILTKVDQFGNIEWAYDIDSGNADWMSGIIETDENDFLIAGRTISQTTDAVGWVAKLNSNGALVWQKYTMNGVGHQFIARAKNDAFVLIGYESGSRGSHLVNITDDGDLLWARKYSFDTEVVDPKVIFDSDRTLVLLDKTNDAGFGQGDLVMMKFDWVDGLRGCGVVTETMPTASFADLDFNPVIPDKTATILQPIKSSFSIADATIQEKTLCFSCADMGDADNDGLANGWEVCGYDYNRDGDEEDFEDVNLPAMGADPEIPDIFVEIDYMIDPGYCIPSLGVCIRGHSYRPDPEAIDMVVGRFRGRGIHLHVDFGDDAPLVYSDDYDTWGDLPHGSGASEIPYERLLVPDNATFNFERYLHLKLNYFSSSRWDVFHYVLFTHFLGGNLYTQTDMRINFTPGIVRALFGSDMVVGLGDNPSVMYQAVTFMHELGHNLGLCHGGPYLLNVNQVTGELGECASEYDYKPNYLSIMSYMYGTRGGLTFLGDGRVDYSGEFQVTSPLDENLLIEANGLGNQLDYYTIRWYCDLGPSIPVSNWQLTLDNTPDKIDWDCNGPIANTSISINRNLQRNEQLHSFDDWSNLKLDVGCIGTRQRCIGRGLDASTTYSSPFGIPTPPALPSIEDSPLESTPIDYGISFASDSFFVVEPNVSSSFPITLTNTGKLTATVTISQTHVASWYNLSTLPTQIVLSPNEVVSYEIFINVPTNVTTGDLQEIALTAFLHESPSLSDSSKTLAQIGPYAWFTANTTRGHIPLTVEFEDLSVGNITSRYWEFGDGFVSTQQNPTHIYTTTGEYTVVLTVTGPNGSDTFTYVNVVRVLPQEIFLPIVLRQ